jgi:hypothetical protein
VKRYKTPRKRSVFMSTRFCDRLRHVRSVRADNWYDDRTHSGWCMRGVWWKYSFDKKKRKHGNDPRVVRTHGR